MVLPALGKLLQHGRLTVLGSDGRQHLILQVILVDVAITVVQLIGIVVRGFLRAHGIAVPARK